MASAQFTKRAHYAAAACALFLLGAGCGGDTTGDGTSVAQRSCESEVDCLVGEACVAGVCAAASADCSDGDVRECGSRVGACEPGSQTCSAGVWSSCVGGVDATPEICNGLDDDCDGNVPADESDGDSDGKRACDGDCNDADATIYSGAPELCDGKDNDCNDAVPSNEMDGDLDGIRVCESDCADDDDKRFPGNPELCDGIDNDCDDTTVDGIDEASRGADCDGDDSDACNEGTFDCLGGVVTCMDMSDDNLEICDGIDNDCNIGTLDGAAETWNGTSCDGPDTDSCIEGVFECVDMVQTCSDTSGDTVDVCDGIDNDCDSSTADGSADAWLNTPCDGPDKDFCDEGVFSCISGAQSCTDFSSDNIELCDSIDNDCDPATADGTREAWFLADCDGPDSDLCNEGTYDCIGGVQQCSDDTGNNVELCDGIGNDCNADTPDGAGEPWFLAACDGDDADACKEGALECVNGAQVCSDVSPDNQELCDGIDNDCILATVDGVDEPWNDGPCDGADSDLCEEGVYSCNLGSQVCSDTTGDILEACDGTDNDCDSTTVDGSGEAWFGAGCDGPDSDSCAEGVFDCQAASQTCTDLTDDSIDICDGLDNDCDLGTSDGSAESWFGTACDGADTDACNEGDMRCVAGASQCSDSSSDSVEVCDGIDNDCNGSIDEIGCSCVDGDTQSCGVNVGQCTVGTQTCVGGAWGACSGQGPTPEVCDGVDNDCDPATLDGNAEPWMGAGCDGPDSDFCQEGTFACAAGVQTCSDVTDDTLDLCDGADNDCDSSTADGSGEAWFESVCDGADSDKCAEGIYTCSAGVQSCSDTTGDNLDICDGFNNDCNTATADGSGEGWYGSPCDGVDADLCAEGTYGCSGGAQSCSDATADNAEACDGVDNDCDVSTPDGASEIWMDDPCDGPDSDMCAEGTFSCSGGSVSCSDTTADSLEVCDAVDNDCDGSTPDGADEAWFGDSCDGADSDLCAEGTLACDGTAQVCTDSTGDSLDVCDGLDNDCDVGTPDGSAEAWYSSPCDGPDSDKCAEGSEVCVAGSQVCDDATGDNLDTCDGFDNDCDSATADGSAEAWFAAPCDGPDSDLCPEGAFACNSGSQSCSDATADDVDTCDNFDNDCDPTTADGSAEAWFMTPCDGPDSDLCLEGANECVAGLMSCADATGNSLELCDGADNDCDSSTVDGSDEMWFAAVCDGADTDLCDEGTFSCSAGAQMCSDVTGDSVEICDGLDNNCDGTKDEIGCACVNGETQSCSSNTGECTLGTQTCVAGAWGACSGQLPSAEVCDGLDNDCDPVTPDGNDEAWLGSSCDGADSDLCAEGVWACTGTQTCTDATGDDLDLCDGLDNDCNATTADGADEVWNGDACDGADTDLCPEGVMACVTGAQACSDVTGNALDVCDGADNDCNSATADGADEAWDGSPCDGTDADSCLEGVFSCSSGAQSCSDATGDNAELCDGADNDCDGSTIDGADESWLGDVCDGLDSDLCAEGIYSCAGGAQACSDTSGDNLELCDGSDNDCNVATADGAQEVWLSGPCDGPDTDLCPEGTYACVASTQQCSDATGSQLDTCDGADNDCNAATPDGSDEAWYGNACDGPDADFCDEGTFGCVASSQSCSDGTGDVADLCDGVDNDCDPSSPDGSDEATYGNPCDGPDADTCDEGTLACDGVALYCTDTTDDTCPCDPSIDEDRDGSDQCADCRDTVGSIYPGATETCNGIDDDCDTLIDEDFDNDGDTYSVCSSDPNVFDCDDSNGGINPGATELCAADTTGNGVDENCNGYTDELCTPCDLIDGDGDGYTECTGDCDDSEPTVYPGAPELCDWLDNDCNELTIRNCVVGDVCEYVLGAVDQCLPGLSCTCVPDMFGNCSAPAICSSPCNYSVTGPSGVGCLPTQACFSPRLASANVNFCMERAIGATNTKVGGVACSQHSECRSGYCETMYNQPQRKYCHDACASDTYCPVAGTVCRMKTDFTAQCWPDDRFGIGPDPLGTTCTSDVDCEHGLCADMGSENYCTSPCCGDDDCPSGYGCSLLGEYGIDTTLLWVTRTAPACAIDADCAPDRVCDQGQGKCGWPLARTIPMCVKDESGQSDGPPGAACTQNADCRSNYCEATQGICIETCCSDDQCGAAMTCSFQYVANQDGRAIGSRVCTADYSFEALQRK